MQVNVCVHNVQVLVGLFFASDLHRKQTGSKRMWAHPAWLADMLTLISQNSHV